MKASTIAFVISALLCTTCAKHSKYFSPDAYLTTPQVIRRHGYTAESHTIETADGYLLEYHRIPQPNNVASTPKMKYPVLLHHGVLSSSADWVIAGPKTSLPYELSDRGFDVWLANARGNTYSRSHVKYSISDRDFWNFSFHEIGIYDLPAAIDYILEVTSAQKLIYIGHSMGTTVFYVFSSIHVEYKNKVLCQISLAPIAAIPHASSLLAAFVPLAKPLEKVVSKLTHGAFLGHNKLAYSFCKQFPHFCERLIFSICGVDPQQSNSSFIPLIASKGPGGTSTKTAVHLSQLVSKGEFRYYDYGRTENRRRYKSDIPPAYQIKDIKVPMMFYYGQNDLLAAPEDVKKLYEEVPRPMGLTLINYEKWNHVDFLWAIEINKYFIDPLLQLLTNAADNSNFVEELVRNALAERAGETGQSSADTSSNEIQYHQNRSLIKPREKKKKKKKNKKHHRIRDFFKKVFGRR